MSAARFFILGAASLAAALAGASGLIIARIAKTFPPAGRFVQTGDVAIHATLHEPQAAWRGDVALIHGASGNQANMAAALAPLLTQSGFRVLAFDRPGHGWSGRPEADGDRPDVQAALIAQAARKLGAVRPIVVAHSFGGAVALALATREPAYAAGFVLISPLALPFTKGVAWHYRLAATPLIGPLFAYAAAPALGSLALEGAIDSVFRPQRAPDDFLARSAAPLALTPRSFLANARDVVAVNAHLRRQSPAYPTIGVPVAIVSGDADDVVSPERHARPLSKIVPGARLNLLPGIGHSPHWVHPEAILEVVLAIADASDQAKDSVPGSANRSGAATAPENSPSAPATSSQ